LNRYKLYSVSLVLAIFTVVFCVYNSYPCIPKLKVHINGIKTIAVDKTKFFVIDELGKRLFIVNEDRKVDFIGKITRFHNAPEHISDASFNKNNIYLCGRDTKDGGLYSTLEHIERYGLTGRYVDTVYSEKIAEEEKIIAPLLVSMQIYKDRLYTGRIDRSGKNASVFCFDLKGSAKEILSTKCPFIILGADYDCEYNKLSVTDCYNNAYITTAKEPLRKVDIVEYFHGDRDSMQNALSAFISINLIKRLALAKTWCWQIYNENGICTDYAFIIDIDNCITFYNIKTGNAKKVTEIPCSAKLICITVLNFISVVWLLLSFLYWSYILYRKCNARLRQKIMYIVCGLIASAGLIIYYSYNIRVVLEKQYKLKTEALSHAAMHDLEHVMPNLEKDIRQYGVKAFVSSELYKAKLAIVSGRMSAICADSGEHDKFYIRLMLYDKDGGLVNYFDGTENYPYGYKHVDYDLSQCMEAIAGGGWVYKNSTTGKVSTYFHALYDDKNMLYGIIETGYNTDNLYSLALRKSLSLFVSLVTILLYLVPCLFLIFRDKNNEGDSSWS